MRIVHFNRDSAYTNGTVKRTASRDAIIPVDRIVKAGDREDRWRDEYQRYQEAQQGFKGARQ